jgi:hypothetical protein
MRRNHFHRGIVCAERCALVRRRSRARLRIFAAFCAFSLRFQTRLTRWRRAPGRLLRRAESCYKGCRRLPGAPHQDTVCSYARSACARPFPPTHVTFLKLAMRGYSTQRGAAVQIRRQRVYREGACGEQLALVAGRRRHGLRVWARFREIYRA